MKKTLLIAACVALAGCLNGSDIVGGALGPDGKPLPSGIGQGSDPTGPDATGLPQVLTCDRGQAYAGFDKSDLVGDRVDQVANMDRARVKPFSALNGATGEYSRVLGAMPAMIATVGTTFGEAPARWYTEPQASAVSLYTAYRVAFQGCLTYTAGNAAFAAAPTAATAATQCATFATKFWSRTAEQAEIDGCVKATVADTATEPTASRRWAYGCASVLTAAGFLTY